MIPGQKLVGEAARFLETVESCIAMRTGPFNQEYTPLVTACRGLAQRLNDETVPDGLAVEVSLYLADMDTGIDSYTGEPMPGEVIGVLPNMLHPLSFATLSLAEIAFGEDFSHALLKCYEEVSSQPLG